MAKGKGALTNGVDTISDKVRNRFQCTMFALFTIAPDSIKWRYGFDRAEVTKGGEEHNIPPPPFLQSLVANLLESDAIFDNFNVSIQYLVVESSLFVSYDVIHTRETPLTCATFDEERISPDAIDAEPIKSLYESLKHTLSKDYKIEKDLGELHKDFPYWRNAGFIDHAISLLKLEIDPDPDSPGKELLVRMDTTYRRHPRAEYSAVFDLPRFPRPEKRASWSINMAGIAADGMTATVSEIVRENMMALELAMGLPNSKIVFIQGEPGSGKEGFASALHYGSKRLQPKDDKPEKFETRSVAGMQLQEFRRLLYGEIMQHGRHEPGLLERVAGGTLFLDEFDKFAKGDEPNAPYSELLRVWEAGKYIPIEGKSELPVKDVNWVVAGAFTSERKISELPPDIWSRITTQLSIKSPLSSPTLDKDDRTAYARALVLNFMLAIGLEHVTNGRGIRESLHALSKPTSRKAAVIRSMLLDDDEKYASQDKLSPSVLTIALANVMVEYIGEYSRVEYVLTKSKSNPGMGIDTENHEDNEGPVVIDVCIPSSLTGKVGLSNGMVTFKSSEMLSLGKIYEGYGLASRRERVFYDSIRTVRQACKIAFARFFEFLLQGKNGCQVDDEWIKRALLDAFVTVDVARKGTAPDKYVSRREWQQEVFGGGVISQDSMNRLKYALIDTANAQTNKATRQVTSAPDTEKN
ncbi:hypothetical protein GCM10017083_41540 [Thalassobaculum fulvum]|uniref:Sigma-54 factor interaction domain-containing protein n=1 Tax=Thalassobaculum fulvum TaxID=1633335 RepID=A0A918XVD2_9PROT|nr:sigma 54-interacting transcriptional regulator [Thalassobaculum fulvum]GHD58495.1 hypothetical protein GCM10017083_41540 [Thalassobaculum fulvum]